jgi:hypothetical protein
MAAVQPKLKDFDQLRTLLRNSKNEEGANLYNHLSQMITYIVMHCPDEGLKNFEEISYLIKNKDKLCTKQFLNVDDVRHNQAPSKACVKELTSKFITEARKFFEVSRSFKLNIFISE